MGAGVMNSDYESEELHSLVMSLGMIVMMMLKTIEVHMWEMVRDKKIRK